MSDGKTRCGEPDRSRTNLNEEYEVRYWTEKFRVTEEQLNSPAVRDRLTLIARELEVPPHEVEAAIADPDTLPDLALDYGINLDWLVRGVGEPRG